MGNIVLMLSIADLKEFYPVDINTEEKYIQSGIKKCQDFIIKPLLGLVKYEEVIEQITTDTLTPLNIELLNMLEPLIANFTMSEIYYATAFKQKNDGKSDNDYETITKIAQKYKSDSVSYTDTVLREWLCLNSIGAFGSYDKTLPFLIDGPSIFDTRNYPLK